MRSAAGRSAGGGQPGRAARATLNTTAAPDLAPKESGEANDHSDSIRRRAGGIGRRRRPDSPAGRAHRSITEQAYGPVIAAITQLLEAGKRDGTIRADADPRDYLQLTGALWRAAIGAGTPIAAALKAAVPPHTQEVRRLVLDRLTPQQVDQLTEISRKILDGIMA